MTTPLTIREATAAGLTPHSRWDAAGGVVYGVKLLGKQSLNGRRYAESAIREAFGQVERTPSYIDHPPGERNERSVTERFGRFAGPYYDADGTLCAREFRFNPRHDFARDFLWLLENAPADVGFSINATATGSVGSDGTACVTGFRKIHSFDVVDRPATTGGMFASVRESVQARRSAVADPLARAAAILFGAVDPPPALVRERHAAADRDRKLSPADVKRIAATLFG